MPLVAALAITLGALAEPAGAQSPTDGQNSAQSPARPVPPVVDARSCETEARLSMDGRAAPATTDFRTLTEKLARSDGVLCPPRVGDDIRVPAPDGGRTPVIPPPGSPGGDPSLRPK